MKNLFRVFAFIIVLSFSQSSLAGLLIEPALGMFNFAQESEQTVSGNTTTSDAEPEGTVTSLKLGYSTFGLALGLDHTILTDKEDTDISSTGLFVSYKFPILVKAYATYFLSSKADGLKSGTGTKIGVGFTGLPFVHLNVEMYTLNYDDTDPEMSSGSFKSTITGTAFTISLPFDI